MLIRGHPSPGAEVQSFYLPPMRRTYAKKILKLKRLKQQSKRIKRRVDMYERLKSLAVNLK